MKVTQQNGHYLLTAETAVDQELIDDSHFNRDSLHVVKHARGPQAANGGYPVIGLVLSMQPDQTTLERDAGVKALRSLRNLQRLLGGQLAQHGHVGTNASNPQAQEALATVSEQLQIMGQARCDCVSQLEAVVEKVISAHVNRLCGGCEAVTVAQQGGAA